MNEELIQQIAQGSISLEEAIEKATVVLGRFLFTWEIYLLSLNVNQMRYEDSRNA